MTKRLQVLIDELYVKEIAKRDAELYALQSQINPHFLYNALSAVSSLAIRKGDTQVSSLVGHLSRFYQVSLNMGRKTISIEKELAITRHYLAIQHIRFADMFEETITVDETLMQHETLKLMLQPFVENAINHAMRDDSDKLHIRISVQKIPFKDGKEAVCFEVEDDGPGIPAEKVENLTQSQPDTGYGIFNVNERIQLAYGKEYGVTIHSSPEQGTLVRLTIPLRP